MSAPATHAQFVSDPGNLPTPTRYNMAVFAPQETPAARCPKAHRLPGVQTSCEFSSLERRAKSVAP